MGKYLLEMFAISLVLTLLFELPVAWCFGMRHRKEILLTVLVNILTNPAAVLLHWLGIPQIPIEFVVLIIEASIYYVFSVDRNWSIPHPVTLALIANAVSWFSGLLIQQIGGIL